MRVKQEKVGLGRRSRNRPVFASAIDLLANNEIAEIGDGDPKWVHIASEGDFPGYDRGERPFSLTRETFEQLIANLHRNPSYVAGDDGVGTEDVVPWDFHHASELYPAEGSIPTQGAPAQAWTRELQVRNGGEGQAQLWALTWFLEVARGYILAGQYKWASLAVTFDTIDPASNENIGAVLTSVALTNQPIIQGMEQLVAARGLEGATAGRHMWFEPAECAEDAMGNLKDLFGLPETSGAPEVVGEIAKLEQWVTQGGAPLGVDVADIIGSMRRIFNLPALSTEIEVLAEAGKVITRLIDEQSVGQGQPAAPGVPVPAAQTAAVAKAKEKDMELLKTLAGMLGVRDTDAEVTAAVEDLIGLRTGTHKALSAEKDTTSVLLEAAEKLVSGREKLTALVKALGVENAEEAVEKVAELLRQSKELTDAMPELDNLRTTVQQQEETQAEADVDEVIASRGYGDEVKEALLLMRKGDPVKFAEKFPKAQPGDESLLSSAAVTPTGVELRPTPPASGTRQLGQNAIPLGTDVVNLASYPGENITARAMSYIRATREGADKWTHEQLFVAACQLKKDPNVVDQVN